ncbi:Gfo/Idh/MocA family oxidoreductase [Catenulispora sp. NF23]|uniref:Gfo/Idh/MocA family protein n=1 Tax=Catenulispora pinistramenti TaxID=2705254 RepID=UPI001BAB6472|nr:Gfo/Idh/MocA family oxidoreductase [Catenulispora pinistramenti]MBS2531767.1 Gfo/Idh/MocA family oxidoreductase [Catenulispora pinistramenti]
MRQPPTVALVGVHGHGRWHLSRVAELERAGRLRLVAVADPRPPEPGALPSGVARHDTLDALLAAPGGPPDITLIATPTPTHFALAEAALRAGSDVLLEKPPVTGLAQLEELRKTAARTGRLVQVGFQSLGSAALPLLRTLVAAGAIGEVTGVGAAGAWCRPESYWQRAPWAGKRWLSDGVPALDGALTNPFAHAIVTALAVLGEDAMARIPAKTELELFHANPVEADDTSAVRIELPDAPPILVAVSVCAPQPTQIDPWVRVQGTEGEAVFHYTTGHLSITGSGSGSGVGSGVEELDQTFPEADLLANLLDHRERPDEVPLMVPLEDTTGFTAVLEAVRDAPEPRAIGEQYVSKEDFQVGRATTVRGIVDLVQSCARGQKLFSEAGAPWALQEH